MVTNFKHIEVNEIGEITVVSFTNNRIVNIGDNEIIKNIKEDLFSLLNVDKIRLLLDFGNVDYIHIDFLADLVSLSKELVLVGGKLVICNVNEVVYHNNFKLTKLYRVFNIVKSQEEALARFN